ncbi:hypothetical protein N9M66_05660 [Litoreibacter sp.]|nr:hypothetical protein [Litoreibacter sp.]
MNEISQQLLYQRLRNRVIELLDLYCSFHDIAKFGAFEAINMVENWLPLDYEKAPKVFSQKEKDAVREFIELWDVAADATHEDTQDVAWLESSVEWVRLSNLRSELFASSRSAGVSPRIAKKYCRFRLRLFWAAQCSHPTVSVRIMRH